MKGFQKHMTRPLSWQPKTFGHHQKVAINWMAIEFF
jgi:hypothetical protein